MKTPVRILKNAIEALNQTKVDLEGTLLLTAAEEQYLMAIPLTIELLEYASTAHWYLTSNNPEWFSSQNWHRNALAIAKIITGEESNVI